MRHLHLGILFRLVPPVAGAWLSAVTGTGPAIATIAAIGAVATAVGTILLRTSPLGRVTWRNIAAGWLMPWGFASGSTTLGGIAITSIVAWVLLGSAGAFAWSTPWLLAAWLLDAVALGYLTGPLWRRSHGRVQRRLATNLIAAVALLALAGLVASVCGQPMLGAVIAGGPLAAIGLAYGVFVGMFVILKPRF